MPAEESSSSVWSREQDKQFEQAIADYPEDCSDRWENIAEKVPGKSLEEIKHHYELLLDDVNRIESGFIPLPCYNNNSSSDGSNSHGCGGGGGDETSGGKKGGHSNGGGDSNHGGKSSRSDQERRKGIAWTEDEHRLFLLGLDKYGKGDWRSISRNFVVTRTPTQVASHAQKYFIRLNSMNKDRRRSSIHDITSVNNGGDAPVPQAPITGQTNGSIPNPSNKSNKPQPAPQVPMAAAPGVRIYGPPLPIGQPIGGPLVSAVGTPVHHLGFGVGAPVVPGAPMNMAPMTYPMPHMSAQR